MKIFKRILSTDELRQDVDMTVLLFLFSGPTKPASRFKIVKDLYLARNTLHQKVVFYFQQGDKFNLFSKASRNGLFDIMKLLVDEGIVNDINSGTPSPLWQAVSSGHAEIARWLLLNPNINKEKAAPDGTTPLMMAILKGQGE